MRKALKSDIPWMVSLSHNKRKSYAEAQKQFWKMAKDSDKIQTKWFEELFEQKNAIALVADNKEGFVIGKVVTPPEVYDAGLTLTWPRQKNSFRKFTIPNQPNRFTKIT